MGKQEAPARSPLRRNPGSEDVKFYRMNVAPVLPMRIIDFHAHTWTCYGVRQDRFRGRKPGTDYMVTDKHYPVGALLRHGQECFPGVQYNAVCFGLPTPAVDWTRDTRHVAAAGRHLNLFPLVLGGKDLGLGRKDYESAIEQGCLFGFKVFLNWFGNDYGNLRITDMLGPNEMDLANERCLILMLHVPRAGRLADPVVQRGVQRLAGNYPNAQIVLAHCGRCYLPQEMKAAVKSVKKLPSIYMDTAMVMDPVVIQMALDTLGPERVLFATDFPVAAMRGRRVAIMDHWVDVVLPGYPSSAYRVSAAGITACYMAWEIVLAIRWAVHLLGMRRSDIAGIFYNNGMRLLRKVDDGKTLREHRARARKAQKQDTTPPTRS